MQVQRCSLSTLAFLLSELVQYTTAQCASHDEMISRLMNAGFEVGRRSIQLVSYRSVPPGFCRTINQLYYQPAVLSTGCTINQL